MRFWKFLALPAIIFLNIANFLPVASPVQAQSGRGAQANLVIDRLQIDLWPEYDRPGVLVIYRINLSQDTALPAQVSLRIPREAKTPFNLAMQNAEGLYNLKFTTQVSGDWVVITFTTPSPNLQLEYYDPHLVKNNDARSYQYHWPGDYSVHSMSIQVQKPLNATDMKIQPDMGTGELGKDGLIYYNDPVGEVSLGTTFQVTLNYTKPDDSLSVNLMPVQPVQPVTDNTRGRISFMEMLPWMIGILGVLLIGGGALWYWQSAQKDALFQPAWRAQGSGGHSERQKPQPQPGSQTKIYCSQCGKRASPGDTFCRTCGSRLHIE